MNINTVDLNLLRAFDAVMREGSITAAGASLGLTQPAMSRAIQRLREVYDDPLFVRTVRGMRPTEYARMLAGPVDNAIAAIRNALELNASFVPATSTRTFRIVMTDIAALFYLPRLVPHLKRSAPGVSIVTVQMPREKYREALEFGTAELALGSVPTMPGSFHEQHLWDEQMVALMRRSHPAIGRTLSMQQFMDTPQITVTPPAQADDMIRRALGRRAAQRRIAVSLPHYLVVPEILSGCDLIAGMPRSVGVVFARKWGLKMLKLPFRVPPMRMSQFWHERSHHDAGHRWLRETIAREFMKK